MHEFPPGAAFIPQRNERRPGVLTHLPTAALVPMPQSPPVFKTLVLPVPRALAFELFTRHASRWWSPLVGANPSDMPWSEIVLQIQEQGRWFETDTTGAEHEWGLVLEAHPPERIVIDWRLAKWTRGTLTELELCFIEINEATTRMTLEHRVLDESAADQREALDAIRRGWTGLLPRFASLCARVAYKGRPA